MPAHRPWIGRIAIELGLRTEDEVDLQAALQVEDPTLRLGDLLELRDQERAQIATALEARHEELKSSVHEEAFERWARAGGEARMDALRLARDRVGHRSGSRVWEALLLAEDLEFDHTPQIRREPVRCGCGFELELSEPLLPFLGRCSVCGAGLGATTAVGATRVEPGTVVMDRVSQLTELDAVADEDLDAAKTQVLRPEVEAFQQQLADEAILRWAQAEDKAPLEELQRLRDLGGDMPLAERFALEGVMSLMDVMECQEHPRTIACAACAREFTLGGDLAALHAELSCPACEGSLGQDLVSNDRRPPSEDDPTNPTQAGGWDARDSVVDAGDAQRRVVDEAFAQWALLQGEVTEREVEEALELMGEGGLMLAEVLAQQSETLDIFDAMEVLEDEIAVVCRGCKVQFQLGRALAIYAPMVPCPHCDTPLPAPAEVSEEVSERRVGPYVLKGLLARGGMGEIHVAEHPEHGVVALKLLSQGMSSPMLRKRFRREARVLEDVDHPNIVKLLSSGFDDQTGAQPYLALELIRGGNLKQVLEQRGERKVLSVAEAAYVVSECSKGLLEVHSHNAVHRDLKPANIMVTTAAEIKLTDFGIALADDVSIRLTAKDEVMGTPFYLPPEALQREDWTGASDVHALGVIFYRLLTGIVPFKATNAVEVMLKIQNEVPTPVSELLAEVPEPVSALVSGMLLKDPDSRPELSEILERLEPYLPQTSEELDVIREHAQAVSQEAADVVPEDPTMVVGKEFGSYRLEAELGRGGMGVVFRAFHTGLKKTVALKLMLAGSLATEADRRRFLREAEAAGGLEHPAIVRVLDVGEQDGSYYLSMDYVQGKPLEPNADDTRGTLELFTRICDGVHHAHTRGVIHRDLKPDNIIVDAQGMPHILDFGIAKKVDAQEDPDAPALTTEGDILGTLRYMPPEQASGEVEKVDVRSDVYALGSILYELVTGGHTPFRGNMRELMHQIIMVEPRPPSLNANNVEVPWELDAICRKVLEKNRDDRYQSALELKQDVERFLKEQPIHARRATVIYRVRKWLRRNRSKAVGMAAVFLAVIGLSGALVHQATAAEQARRAGIAEGAARGWELVDAREFEQAAIAFGKAHDDAQVSDVLVLPARAVEFLPDSVVKRFTEAERLQPRVNRDRLEDWVAFARERIRFQQANNALATAKQAREEGKLREASTAIKGAMALTPDDPQVLEYNALISAAFVEIGQGELESLHRRQVDDYAARWSDIKEARAAFDEAWRLDRGSKAAMDGLSRARVSEVLLRDHEAQAERIAQAQSKVQAAERLRERSGRGSPAEATQALASARDKLIEAVLLWGKIASTEAHERESVRVALALGRLALDRGKLETAEQELEKAGIPGVLADEVQAFAKRLKSVDRKARAFAAHEKRATALYVKGDLRAARKAYDEALAQREDGDVQRKRDLCQALIEADDAQAAVDPVAERKALLRARSLHTDPVAVEPRIATLGEALYLAAVDQADQEFAVASQRRSGWPQVIALYELALAYSRRGSEALRGRADAYAESRRPPGMVLVSIPSHLLAKGAMAGRVGGAQALRYYVDEREVTNQQFSTFVAAGGYDNRELWTDDGWERRVAFVDSTGQPGPLTWVGGAFPTGADALPVSGLSWYEAKAYATWADKRLPSEEEWVLACCFEPATTRRTRYPWGDELPSVEQRRGFQRVRSGGGSAQDVSPWGARDMGFNVAEWVQGTARDAVVRGLSFQVFEHDLELGPLEWRKTPRASFRDTLVGFRCAREVDPAPSVPVAGEDR